MVTKTYDADGFNKEALTRIVEWSYTSEPASREQYIDDTGRAFHYAATPQGHEHWAKAFAIDPTKKSLSKTNKDYLAWLLNEWVPE